MGDSGAMRGLFIGFLAVLAVTAVMGSDDLMAGEKLLSMTREELIKEVTKVRKERDSSNIQSAELERQLTKATGEKAFNEEAREANEKRMKKKEKDQSEAKKEALIQKKEKLSDILMEHGATFLAFKAAKKFKNKGSTVQKQKVLQAAKKGARAGAVGPLKKVARDAAVKAVKTARAKAKKDNITKKKEIHVLTKQAATAALKKLLDDQDELVEKCVQKVTAIALKKYKPTIFLAEHEDGPNNFAAPPMIHLSLGGNDDANDEVQKLKDDVAQKEAVEKKTAQSVAPTQPAPPTIHLSLGDSTTSKKTAAAAKQDASTIVPESN